MISRISKSVDNLYQLIKKHLMNVLQIKTSPHEIAFGFAVGTFIEILPTYFGLDYIIALLIILIYPKISKISLFGAIIMLNVFILTPIHLLNFYIGNLIFAGEPVLYFQLEFWNNLINISRRVLIGSLITGPIISVIVYFIIKKLVIKVQSKSS